MKKIAAAAATFLLMGAGLGQPFAVRADSAGTFPGETIDTLNYFVSKHLDQGLTGSHNQSQIVSGQTSYYLKWSASAFEVHTWDDNYIYLREDHSWQNGQGYAFRPGRWLKRSMQVGESVAEPSNQGYYFTANTCNIDRVTPLPYVNTLESHMPSYDLGGDLGRQDVIVLKYDYSTQVTPGNFERFYYSKDWGWVKWELYQNGVLAQTSIFNKIIARPAGTAPTYSCTRGGTVVPDDPVIYPLPVFSLITGKVVHTPASPALYYITPQGQREYICSSKTLGDYGVGAADIQTVSADDLAYYPPVIYVKLKSGAVYKLDGRYKRLVRAGLWNKYNIDPAGLVKVSPADLSCYKTGTALR